MHASLSYHVFHILLHTLVNVRHAIVNLLPNLTPEFVKVPKKTSIVARKGEFRP